MTQASRCSRCASPLERGDLRCTICGLPTPRPPASAVTETTASILRCHGCGAAVAYDPTARAPKCAFCRSVMEVETPDDPVEQASRFLRFTVEQGRAREALRTWLGKLGFFRPGDLQAGAAVTELKPLWWVGWIFHANTSITWAADSDFGAHRSNWAPHAGEFDLELRNVVVPASRGLSIDECRALLPGYDLRRSSPTAEGHPEATIEQFSVQRSAARRVILEALENVARGSASSRVPGSRQRKLRVGVLPKALTTDRLAFPAYVLAYRYRDRLYRAVVHGQDPSIVVGTAPWSIGRIAAVVAGVLLLVAVIVVLASR